MKVSIQLISLPDFSPDSSSLGKDNSYPGCFARPLVGLGWPVLVLCPCALGATVFCAWKRLGNSGAKLIELKFSQCLISGLNQYQLILKYRRVCSTCITLISFCAGSIQQTASMEEEIENKVEKRKMMPGTWVEEKEVTREETVGIIVKGACSVSQKCHQ